MGGFSEKLLPCPAVPIPAGFRMDVPLAKAEHIRNGGGGPGVTDLRRKKKSNCAVVIGTREEKGGNTQEEQPHRPQGQFRMRSRRCSRCPS